MKRFNLILFVLISFVGVLFLISCNLDSKEVSSPKDSNQYQTLTDSKNPLEYIGIEHNKFMEKFMHHLEKSKENGLGTMSYF